MNNNDSVTLSRILVEQAIQTLEGTTDFVRDDCPHVWAAVTVLRAALEHPQVEQEPFCYVNVNKQGDVTSTIKRKDSWRKTPLYLHPQPKRQPLTDEEISKMCPQFENPMRREMWIIGFKAAHGIAGEQE